MRCMPRNKVPFYFALYCGKEPIIDEYGNDTGEYTLVYSKPVKCKANISAATGETINQQFGTSELYDKVIVCDKTVIDEYSRLWIDCVPELDEQGALVLNSRGEPVTPHDYVVKKVSRSLNLVSIGITKVNVQ